MNKSGLAPYTLRNFVDTDAPTVSKLILRCLVETNSKDYSGEQIQKMVPGFAQDRIVERFSGMRAIVADTEQGVIGIAGLAGNEIRSMFVSPDCQGQGVGAAIVGHLEGIARSLGILEVVVFSSKTAKGFYSKMGYTMGEDSDHPIAGVRTRFTKYLRA